MIGERIKNIRKELKLNQLEFGNNISISKSQMSSIESGYRALTERTKNDIIRVYNVNPEYLESGTEPMFLQEPRQKEEIKRMLPKLESLTVEQLNALDTLIDSFKEIN